MESPSKEEVCRSRPKKRTFECCDVDSRIQKGSPVKSPKRAKKTVSPKEFIQCATVEAQRSGRVPSYVGNYKLSSKERMRVLHNLRNVGVWVQCCNSHCSKWRYVEEIKDPTLVPSLWYCHMNSDINFNDCSKPEQVVSEETEEDFIENEFTAGSIVWAKFGKYPYWPAIVEDDPDFRQFYVLDPLDPQKVNFYHVSFLDPLCKNRAWLPTALLRPFTKENSDSQADHEGVYFRSLKYRILKGKEMALKALEMDVSERLRTYSFVNRQKMKVVHKQFGKRKRLHKKKRGESSFAADIHEDSFDAMENEDSQKSDFISDDSDFESCFSHMSRGYAPEVESKETPSVYSQLQDLADDADNSLGLFRSFSARIMNLSRSLFRGFR